MGDEGPKWRLDHADTGSAICQQAACKRNESKIVKGELRIGTRTLFDNGIQSRWYMAWRHWGCATKHQIAGLKETTENDPTKAPGYDRLSPESQEQVRLAFEKGMPVDKGFKDIREDLAKNSRKYAKEYRDAEGYKADVATRAAACRGGDCVSDNIKIIKGHLRLGILVNFDGEHVTPYYKHWKCMSKYDLACAQMCYEKGEFYGIDNIPEEFKEVVLKTFETGEVVEPPEPKVAPPKTKAKPKSKTPRSKKTKVKLEPSDSPEESEDQLEDPNVKLQETISPSPVAKPKAKKSKAKRRPAEDIDSGSEAEPEYVPRKSRSRSSPFKEANVLAEAATSAPEDLVDN
ncbi:hypothetical protein COCMIDRAFT_101987 [Bipolaris oryzae ATCC 44560]|uniref:PARP-type domain-containing protein n=1 Tax=Bipolaris oryzae ATCC 44560 TaxID=930090 RepID=W6ZHJ7_COCMI|nr:uncharacterized protein COCMIDRAFT_101987 [Bipolaris oryzae ATCC 44560]EUC43031.1 hypothetical protein COCMIDRAFT_101987 [Bipolaris oryzae ATCC 44560]